MPGRSLTPLEVPGAAASELLPRQDSLADELRFLLHSAVFTLSDGYVPPWRYQIDGNRADLYVDFERTWQGTDPAGREMTVACGAALSYLDAVALRRGRAVAIAPYPDPTTPDLVARVRLEPGAAAGRPRPAGRERLVWDTAPAPPVAVVRDALEAAVAGTNVWLQLGGAGPGPVRHRGGVDRRKRCPAPAGPVAAAGGDCSPGAESLAVTAAAPGGAARTVCDPPGRRPPGSGGAARAGRDGPPRVRRAGHRGG